MWLSSANKKVRRPVREFNLSVSFCLQCRSKGFRNLLQTRQETTLINACYDGNVYI